METFHYAGFLSYAHADEAIAARLHKTLERFRIPKGLKRSNTLVGLSPIFRDSEELSAHHSLSEKITSAVDSSRFLIVLCSPAAKTSHWVNEEIRLFRERRGDAFIISALTEGTPETAFPPALTEGGREPLAANLTPESFHQGVSQIAAAMLGVGLDDLVQRAAKRKTRRLQFGMAASFALTAFMGGAAYMAIDARNAAVESRGQAEELVQFMVTDLRKELTAKERLSVLASIGERVTDYYDAQDTDRLPDTSLVRQAKAREVLGQVAIDMNELDKAQKEIDVATRLSEKVLAGNLGNPDAIFAHAQSIYWQGQLAYRRDDTKIAREAWTQYAKLGETLYAQNPENPEWIMERGYGANNLAFLDRHEKKFTDAERRYGDAIEFYRQALKRAPESREAEKALSNAMAGAASVSLISGRADEALLYRKDQIELLSGIQVQRPGDIKTSHSLSQARLQAYLIEVHLDPTACSAQSLKPLFDEFMSLLAYDPDNVTWRNNALGKWGKAVSFCAPHLPGSEAREIVDVFLEAIEDRDKASRLAYRIYDMTMMQNVLSRTPSQTLLPPFNPSEPMPNWERLRRADYSAALGQKDIARDLAETITPNSSLSPESVRLEVQRLRHIGNCQAAAQLLKRRKMTNPAPQNRFNLCKSN